MTGHPLIIFVCVYVSLVSGVTSHVPVPGAADDEVSALNSTNGMISDRSGVVSAQSASADVKNGETSERSGLPKISVNRKHEGSHKQNMGPRCRAFNALSYTNNTQLVVMANKKILEAVLRSANRTQGCTLLLFFAPWSKFCARLAPAFNAVGRLYKDLAVMAVDVSSLSQHSTIAQYGIVGVPTVVLIYGDEVFLKFNLTQDLSGLVEFIYHNTGMFPAGGDLRILPEDIEGPIRVQLVNVPDYLSVLVVLVSVVLSLTFYAEHTRKLLVMVLTRLGSLLRIVATQCFRTKQD